MNKEENKVVKEDTMNKEENKVVKEDTMNKKENEVVKQVKDREKEEDITLSIDSSNNENINKVEDVKKNSIQFNDKDQVLDFNKKETPRVIEDKESQFIEAPKTIERLEEISSIRDKERRENEEEDDDDEERIKIFDDVNVELDNLDIHNIDSNIKLKTDTDVLLDDMIVELK